jgi:lipopolysaccharide transport system ATP-binding protein
MEPTLDDPIKPVMETPPATAGSDVVIAVRSVGKMYRLYDQPQDRLKEQLLWRFGKHYGREFWALRDVSFEVRRGETVGIIGRNGSGKSTLLQMIAGTLAPTQGEIVRQGRMSALLELGSGFNPVFSGRENVFLSGSIMGISHEEMENRYAAIAAFADIGKFMDQPVKTYSSGMFARLAFSVAIAVDPDILIVDEILAVGDYGFQQKCVARLRQMRDTGLTLLFVSHSPDAIKSICTKGLYLIDGQPVFWGQAEQAVNHYFNNIRQQANADAMKVQADIATPVQFESKVPGSTRYGTGHVQIQNVELYDDTDQPCRAFRFGDSITLKVHFKTYIELDNCSVSFLVRDLTGIDLTGTTTFDEKYRLPTMRSGTLGIIRFRFKNRLRAGNFGISVALNRVSHPDYSDNILLDQADGCASFVVIPDPDRPVHYKFHIPVEIDFLPKEEAQ